MSNIRPKSMGGLSALPTDSETPRTDAALMNRLNMTERDFFWWVKADFARTLEGELNETRQLLAEKNETANVFMRQVKELQSQVAELINQRNQLLDKNSALKMLCADNGITVKSITVATPQAGLEPRKRNGGEQ